MSGKKKKVAVKKVAVKKEKVFGPVVRTMRVPKAEGERLIKEYGFRLLGDVSSGDVVVEADVAAKKAWLAGE